MIMPDNTPRRIKELQEELGELNGDSITANQSRRIVRKIGESQLDLWDYMTVLIKKLDRVDEMYNAYKIGRWVVALQTGAIILYFTQQILMHIFSQ
jgi:hypothetical protein